MYDKTETNKKPQLTFVLLKDPRLSPFGYFHHFPYDFNLFQPWGGHISMPPVSLGIIMSCFSTENILTTQGFVL